MTLTNSFNSLLLTLLLSLSFQAHAMTLQQAMGQLSSYKSQGLVGEQTNGYLGVVTPKKSASELIKLINQARLNQYKKLANTNQLSLKNIEALAGKKAIQKTQPGHYIKIGGQWRKK